MPPVAHLPATFLTDMIQGEELAFDLESIKVAGTDFVCLHIVGPAAQVWCRWDLEANRYQVAAALERLAARLRSDKPL